MRQLYDRTELIAEIDLVDGELTVKEFDGRPVSMLMEEMRGEGMTDTELWDSLPERLTGHLWLAEVGG